MTRIRPFEPADVVALDLQDSQRGQLGIYEPDVSIRQGYVLRDSGPCFTALDGRGEVVASAGFAEVFGDRQATAWALFAEGWWQRVDRRKVVRALHAALAAAPYARVEALARAAAVGECRLLEALRFRRVCELAQWGPHSETVVLFERLRPSDLGPVKEGAD